MTDKELKDKYLGKRISVPWKHPNPLLRGDRNDNVTGICKNIGHNSKLPSWGLVVVIGRFPISNVDYTQIKIINNEPATGTNLG